MASNSDGGFQSPAAEVSAANLAKHFGDRGKKIVYLCRALGRVCASPTRMGCGSVH
jgi:hypothetical protein